MFYNLLLKEIQENVDVSVCSGGYVSPVSALGLNMCSYLCCTMILNKAIFQKGTATQSPQQQEIQHFALLNPMRLS